jgi:hypothetical protein
LVASFEVLWDAESASGTADITGVSSFDGITDARAAIIVSVAGTVAAVAIDLGMGEWAVCKLNSSINDLHDAGSQAGADEGGGLCAGRDTGNAKGGYL